MYVINVVLNEVKCVILRKVARNSKKLNITKLVINIVSIGSHIFLRVIEER